MARKRTQDQPALGFTVKSGWAAAVLLGGPAAAPRVLDVQRLELSDPAIPEARQPYHDGFATARESGPELSRLVASVERFAGDAVAGLLERYRAEGHEVVAAGVVVGSLQDPSQIANPHIRIHAREGQLFRQVVEDAVTREQLVCSIWRERDLYGYAAESLERPEPELRAALAKLPRTPGPWRAEHKAAALAAWLLLAGSEG
jgi:hypothetical protein